jgi:hypothetical protein
MEGSTTMNTIDAHRVIYKKLWDVAQHEAVITYEEVAGLLAVTMSPAPDHNETVNLIEYYSLHRDTTGASHSRRVETGSLDFGDYPSEALIHKLADALNSEYPRY